MTREERIDRVIAAYLEAVDNGCPPEREQWLRQHPDIADDLLEFLGDREHFQQFAADLQSSDSHNKHSTDSDVTTQATVLGPAEIPATSSRDRLESLVLEILNGSKKGLRYVARGHCSFVAGRDRSAQFRLADKDRRISRQHFMVECNPPLCRLVDLRSNNGTFVNGARVESVDLVDGDVISVGHTFVKVSLDDSTHPPGTSDSQIHNAPAGSDIDQSRLPEIDGYRLLGEIGRGGMGIVYRARRVVDDELVAIKTVEARENATSKEIRRFIREANIAAALKHPHIVKCLEAGHVQNRLAFDNVRVFFVMEHVPGVDAERLLQRQGPLEISQAVSLVCQILEALQCAHDQGFVHRDVKPANILIGESSSRATAKLTDFGLARAYQASTISGLTILGEMGGTLTHIAPEQITDFRGAQPAVDQYSAAASLYRLLTGSFLFDFGDAARAKCLSMVLFEDPVCIRKRRPEVPVALAKVLHKSLQKNPADRHPSVRALRDQLWRFAIS